MKRSVPIPPRPSGGGRPPRSDFPVLARIMSEATSEGRSPTFDERREIAEEADGRMSELYALLNIKQADEQALYDYLVQVDLYEEHERWLADADALIAEQERRWELMLEGRMKRRSLQQLRDRADEHRAAILRRRRREELIERMIRDGCVIALMFVI